LINRARLQELQVAPQENLSFYIEQAKLPRNDTHNFLISIGLTKGQTSREEIPSTSGTKEPIVTNSFSYNIDSILNASVMTVNRKEM
jgi:hypothetical protein